MQVTHASNNAGTLEVFYFALKISQPLLILISLEDELSIWHDLYTTAHLSTYILYRIIDKDRKYPGL